VRRSRTGETGQFSKGIRKPRLGGGVRSQPGPALATTSEAAIITFHDTSSAAGSQSFANGTGPEPFDFLQQVGHLLRKAYQRHTAIFQAHCPEQQLTAVQVAVLSAVAKLGPTSLSSIGRAAALDPATTRGVADRLRDKGLVILAPDTEDRRKILVHATPTGRQLLPRLIPMVRRINDATMKGLNPAECVALIYLLNKISGPDPLEAAGYDLWPLESGGTVSK
jgi:DNA-binding MarR family transcriptional regulator